MASVSPKIRIFGALVVAGVLIAGSIFISNNGLALFTTPAANAASTQALLQAYATRDSDGDGLPDWEEALYGLDPHNAHSFSPDMTDGEAVARGLVKPKFLISDTASSTASTTDDLDGSVSAPGSLTAQFSQILLTQYLTESSNDDGTPSDTDLTTAAQIALQTFAQTNEHQNEYTIAQVQVGNTGQDAMKKYAADAENVFAENNPGTQENELIYFSDVVEKNDPNALKNLIAIGNSYTDMAPAFMKLQVPIEAENSHLEIANAMYRLGADVTDMSMLNSDPLRAYFGLAQYQADAQSLSKGVADIGTIFSTEQVTIPQSVPGYYFIKLTSSDSLANLNMQN
jgi:hypothetical protein